MMENQTKDNITFKIAFKKLKSSIYYDKTQLILRNDIVRYEQNSKATPHKVHKLEIKHD